MPTTPVYGITYPCSGDTIDPDVFATFANSLSDALVLAQSQVDTLLDRPSASVRSIANVNLAVNTDLILTFDTELFDNASMANLAVSNDRLTITTSGVYFVTVATSVISSFASGTSLILVILVNGVERNRWKTRKIATAGGILGQFKVAVDLNAGDFVQFQVRWTGAGGPETFQTRVMSASLAVAK